MSKVQYRRAPRWLQLGITIPQRANRVWFYYRYYKDVRDAGVKLFVLGFPEEM